MAITVTLEDTQTTSSSGSGTDTMTWSTMAIGTAAADRMVIACLSNRKRLIGAGATIGGQTATFVSIANGTNASSSVMWALVTSGTTADIVITMDGTTWLDEVISVYSMIGADTSAANDSGTASAADDVPSDSEVAIAVNTNGVIIAQASIRNGPSTGTTWSGGNLVEDHFANPGTPRFSSASSSSGETSGTKTCSADWVQGVQNTIAAVSFDEAGGAPPATPPVGRGLTHSNLLGQRSYVAKGDVLMPEKKIYPVPNMLWMKSKAPIEMRTT